MPNEVEARGVKDDGDQNGLDVWKRDLSYVSEKFRSIPGIKKEEVGAAWRESSLICIR